MIWCQWFLSLALIIAASLHGPAQARTWTVELDGSGDFTVLQDALDAAAPGDSVVVGPGRFDTFRPAASTVDGYPFAAIAWVTTTDLTIVGAGPDLTQLGPATPILESGGLGTACLYIDGGAITHVEKIGFTNSQALVTIREQCVVEDCRVDYEALTNAFAVTVLNSHAVELRRLIIAGPNGIAISAGSNDAVIEECTFEDPAYGGLPVAVVGGSLDCAIRRCTFQSGITGVSFGGGSTGVVEDCEFVAMSFAGVNVESGAAVLRRCVLGETQQPLRVNAAVLEVYDSVVRGGTTATIVAWGQVLVRNSHLHNAGALTVRGRTSVAGEVVDLRHNWWGTTDETQIEAWVDDPYHTVLWQPIADSPIPTGEASVSSLKSRFGSQ